MYSRNGGGGKKQQQRTPVEVKHWALMKLESWNSAEFFLRGAMKQNVTGKQVMHACHSHNYYFIKELLPLAGVLWHCCEKPGTAPEEWRVCVCGVRVGGGGHIRRECGGRGRWDLRRKRGTGVWRLGEATCFNLGQLPVCKKGVGVTEPPLAPTRKNTYVVQGIQRN